MLRTLVPTWVWAAVLGLAATGGLGWWGIQAWEARVTEREALTQQLEALEANRDRWHSRALEVFGQMEAQRQRARQAEQAVETLQQALAERETAYRQARQRVRQAPEQDDGPVAPVLRQALEDLPHAHDQ